MPFKAFPIFPPKALKSPAIPTSVKRIKTHSETHSPIESKLMSDFEDIRARLIKLELTVETLVKSMAGNADDRKWMVRIILGGVVSAFLLWIKNGGLADV